MVSGGSSGSSGSASPGDEFHWEDSDGDGVYRVKRCCCGTRLKIHTTWGNENPGRRFVRCPYREEFNCGFFQWIDPSFPTQATKVILDLTHSNSTLERMTNGLVEDITDRNAEIQRLRVDFDEAKGLAEFISKMDDDKRRQLEVAGKEIRRLVVSLKWHQIISPVVVAVVAVAAARWFTR